MSELPAFPTSLPAPRRLLVRGVNWVGDAVMTTPALLRLREALPATHVTLLTHEKLAGLWAGHPAVDAVMTFAAKEGVFSVARRLRSAGSIQPPSARSGADGDCKSPARGAGFDAALVLPNSWRSGLEVALARIPQRIGYAGGGRTWLLTRAIPWRTNVAKMHKRTPAEVRQLIASDGTPRAAVPASSHHLFHYLHLAAALGAKPEPLAPLITVTDAEVAAVKAKFALPDGLLLGLNAGAEYGPAKRWPAENFSFMAREAVAWPGWGVVLLGGKADMAEAATMEKEFWESAKRWSFKPLLFNLAGRTSLRELCAVFRACRVVVTNDTGPMHVAAAVGARLVGLFGSTSIELTGPGLPGDPRHVLLRGDAPCAPCFLRTCPVDFRCMKSLTTERVIEAVFEAAE